MNITILKTEVQVNLATIADMSAHARSLLAPYRKFGSNVRILNINRPEERVQIEFKEDEYIIALDWNLLALVHQGRESDLAHGDGVLRLFLDAWQKVRVLDGFSGIDSVRTLVWYFVEDHCPTPSSFRARYLTGISIDSMDKLADVGILLEGSLTSARRYHVTFGPFRPSTDIEAHNLLAVKQGNAAFIAQLEAMQGLILRLDVTAESSDVTFELISRMLADSRKLAQQIIQ